jgi:polyhydroxybutyrate depolymerase
VQSAYFNVNTLPADGEALVLAPDGLVDTTGKQFWNADPSCCDFYGRGQDDVTYIGELIDAVIATWPVDPTRVMLVGHSNGGYMGYRMACERADVITTVAILAGNTSRPATACAPAKPVNMLVMHGTDDATVSYAGNTAGIGAEAAASRWAQYDGCGASRTMATMLDLEQNVVGAETRVEIVDGCPIGVGVTLWRHEGVGHIPTWTAAFKTELWTWLSSHLRS